MTSPFDNIIERRGSGCAKWDSIGSSELLPMWVADMDFETAPVVKAALHKRVDHGVFGYTHVPDSYYKALIDWYHRRHGADISREAIVYTSGVVPAISAILKAITLPGNGVVVQTPVYNCFFSCIRNMGCQVVASPLCNQNGYYEMDFVGLEEKLSDSNATAMILCNPHNPVGRTWTKTELEHVADLCLENGVTLISDEIHCDLVFPEEQFHSLLTLDEKYQQISVTTNSPSKAFNIAGLQIANIICSCPKLRARIDKAINIHEVCDVNPFGVEALIAAYNEGEAWLNELNEYIYQNYLTVMQFVEKEMPLLTVCKQQATYLAWIDCSKLELSMYEIDQRLKERGHVMLSVGSVYGDSGDGFIRLNMACPRAQLVEGLKRIKYALSN